MALSEELPLYRDTYRLLNNLLILTQDFPRFFRYSMGSRMVDLTLDMLSLIYKANSSYEKVGVLTEFLDRYRMLQMLFRVCVEQKVITERKYASFGLLLEKIGKQATSWKQYNERGMKKQEDKKAMIYQSGFGRSRLPEANCLLLKKGCRQAFLVQGGSQRQKQTTFTGPPRSSTTIRRTTLFM